MFLVSLLRIFAEIRLGSAAKFGCTGQARKKGYTEISDLYNMYCTTLLVFFFSNMQKVYAPLY